MKIQTKTTIIGSIIGFLILWYDFDFFINVSGPETPISDFLRELIGLNGVGLFQVFIIPMIILITIFGLIGFIIGIIIQKYKLTN